MREETIAIHHGYEKDTQRSMAVPIYQTTAYEFDSTDHGAKLFSLQELGNIYTRLNNPTTDLFEKRFAELEGGIAGLATSSGMSAIFYSIINLAEAGDNIIAAYNLYGGTMTQFGHTMKRFGIEVRFVDISNADAIKEAIDEKTKAIFYETISNPAIEVPDIGMINKIADEHKIITIADNTVATPVLCKPIEFGTDIVVHSTSKYVTGQGLAMGGLLVEASTAKEKMIDNDRYYHFNEPDASYHGLVYTATDFPPFILRARLSLLRDLGAAISPFNSWLLIQGLETLSLRMAKHSENTMKIAEFLQKHPKVKEVRYPYLEGDKYYENAKKYISGGCSGLLAFEVEDYDTAKKIADNTKIFAIVTNIGDTKSIVTHSASTTHQQLSQEEKKAAGISDGLLRLSVGIENVEDLIEDLAQAIES
jgi:O-acetylhomoserine (thiol)-lyase